MLCAWALLPGCGDNVYDPSNPDHVDPPRNLQALAWDTTSVGLQWLPPSNVVDSVIRGYRIAYNGLEDSVLSPRTVVVLRNLPLGKSTFAVLTLLRNGVISQPVSIQWAPASRFDSQPVVIYEEVGTVGVLPQAMHVGSRTTSPYPVMLSIANAAVIQLVLQGSGGQQLKLQSPTYALQNANLTLFSSTSHSSQDLDYYLSTYPSTYDLDQIPVVDNTIYYVRLRGDNTETNYARLHVHVTPGTAFPNRSVVIRVSIQRQAELQFAQRAPEERGEARIAPLGLLPVSR